MDSKNFIHLQRSSGTFPHTQNVNTEATLSTFDYKVWDVNTKIEALSVPWDSQYRNVVSFESAEARDEYFESKCTERNTFVLSSMQNLQPDDSIRLPVPFDVLARCNYLRVELPSQPIPYESEDSIHVWYYFITDVRQIAPSTTQCYLQLDYWTTFIDEANISYLMLARGHAPMAAAPSPSEYLEAPSSSSALLLAPDIDAGDESTNLYTYRGNDYLFGEEGTLAVLGVDANVEDMSLWGDMSDTTLRRIPSLSLSQQEVDTTYSLLYLAMRPYDLAGFLSQMIASQPWLYDAIQVCFFAPSNLVETVRTVQLFGMSVSIINSKRITKTIATLQPEDFNLPEQYARITKLYTYPYTMLKMYSDDGSETIIKTETLTDGKVKVAKALTLAGSIITADVHLIDVQGGDNQAEWWIRNEANQAMNDAGYIMMKSWNVPTFAIYQDSTNFTKYNQQCAYNSSKNSIDTAYTNTTASADTALTNSQDAATTSYNQTVATNNMAKQNSDDSLNTTTSNVNRSSAVGPANTALSTAAASTVQARVNANSTTAVGWSNSLQQAVQAWDAGLQRELTDLENKYAAATTDVSNNVLQQKAQLQKNTAVVGWIGSLLGGQIGVGQSLTSLSDYINIDANLGIDTSSNSQSTLLLVNQNTDRVEAAISNSQSKLNEQNKNNTDVNNLNSQTATDNTDTQNSTATQQAANVYNASIANASASQSTGLANNARTQSVGNSNAEMSNELAHRVAQKTHDQTYANAERTRDTGYSNIYLTWRQSEAQAPRQHSTVSGSEHLAARPQGVTLSVGRESDAAIKTAGDYMLRYGYSLNQAWTVDKWQVMKHYTYWKADDLWISMDRAGIEDAGNSIEAILRAGTTVWSKPEEIGRVSLYDNWK